MPSLETVHDHKAISRYRREQVARFMAKGCTENKAREVAERKVRRKFGL